MFAMGPAFFKQAGASYATLTLAGTFAAATVGVAYSSSIPISGGMEPYSLTGGTGVASGSLDSGFSLSITGTTGARFLTLSCASPTTADTMTFTASVDSSDGQTATSAQSVTVSAAAVRILDSLSTPAVAAFSLRKLRSAYTGPAIRVDNTGTGGSQDIGFDASGNFDSAALLAFLGPSQGLVSTWYDQSGNGLNVTAVTGSRPRVATGGTVESFNSRPALNFGVSSTSALSNAAGAIASTAGWTVNAVAKPSVYTTAQQSVFDQDNYPTSAQRIAQYLRFAFGAIQTVVGPSITATGPTNSPAVLTAVCTSSALTAYGDGVGGTPATVTGAVPTGAFPFRLGQSLVNGGAINFVGKYCEAVAFSAPISPADRQTLERNQGAYYGVTVA